MSDVLMTVAEAAGYLRCHPQTVRSLIHSGRLPAVKLNRQYRIKLEDLQAGVRPVEQVRQPAVSFREKARRM